MFARARPTTLEGWWTTTFDSMDKAVLDFIKRFTQNGKNQGTIDSFTNGCCYWFAKILSERFRKRNPKLMYDQVENHFGCRIGDIIYDITGDVTDKYKWETWGSVRREDELLAKRINRDCINF